MRLTKAIPVELIHGTYIVEHESNRSKLQSKGFGFELSKGVYALLPYEALYLLELKKIEIFENNEKVSFEQLLRREEILFDEYLVFKDLTTKGYSVKSGLKFGVSFRMYKKQKRMYRNHALWLVYVIHDYEDISAKTFSSLGRIAHSTKKKVLFAIVDSEKSITYYEYEWTKI